MTGDPVGAASPEHGGAVPSHPAYRDTRFVDFCVPDGGSAALTWGQRAIWQSLQWTEGEEQFFNGATVIELPETSTVHGLLAAVHALTVAHQSLRSHYPLQGEIPVQVVAREGRVPVGIVDSAGAAADPAGAGVLAGARDLAADRALAERIRDELGAMRLDEAEWPWRCVAVLHSGAPRFLVFVASHQIIDGWSFHILADQLRDWTLQPPSDAGDASRALQPLEQAEYERGEQAARRNEGSLRYWSQTLGRVAPSMFDRPRLAPKAPRFVKLSLSSAACATASRTIADRLRVRSSVVLLATTAAVLASVSGHGEIALSPIVANRFDRPRRALVAPVTQDGLFVLDVRRAKTFDALVRAAYSQALTCYHFAYYDPVQLAAAVRDVELSRGVHVDVAAYFNDNRLGQEWEATVSSQNELEKLVTGSTLTQVGAWDRVDAKFFVAIGSEVDTCRIDLTGDTAYMSQAALVAALTGFESVLVAAAFADVPMDEVLALPEVPPVPRGASWLDLGGRWADLDACGALVRQVVAPAEAAVFAEPAVPDSAHPRLVAYLVAQPGATPEAVHAAVVRALAGRTDVAAPDEYVACRAAPVDAADRHAWDAQAMMWRGTGRDRSLGEESR